MKRRTTVALAIGGGALLAATAGAAIAISARDSDAPITGPDLDRASAAALAHTGGGRVTDTEIGDEEGFYEVEVLLDDGRQVDVHLNQDFTVIGTEAEGAETEASDDD